MTDPLLPEKLDRYLENLVPARVGRLEEMERQGRLTGFPIIGPTCGHFCYLVARMISARQVFEMGSGYGYSTAWLARAVQENGGGKVVHTVRDEVLSAQATANLSALGYGDVLDYRVGDAVAELRRTPGPFDLILLDIDKEAYPEALDVIEARLRRGGVLLADNLLLGGAVLDGRDRSPRARAMHEFTRRVTAGERWIASIVPMRDGVLLAVRQ
ncbi:MAG TPA: O-methyltransferase [Anaerolineales bacterium]|nr:O-methyltransferase [Anaerolineales bacterium]